MSTWLYRIKTDSRDEMYETWRGCMRVDEICALKTRGGLGPAVASGSHLEPGQDEEHQRGLHEVVPCPVEAGGRRRADRDPPALPVDSPLQFPQSDVRLPFMGMGVRRILSMTCCLRAIKEL
nr:hypothetical protein B0A51_14326 [Rachicladosporium sp. CCFEE 5018]